MKLSELTPEIAQSLHTRLVQQLIGSESFPSPQQWQILQGLHGFAYRQVWRDLAQQHYHRQEQEAFLGCANFANEDNSNFERHHSVLKEWLASL